MKSLAKLISSLTSPKLLMGITLIVPSLWYGSLIIPMMTIIMIVVVKVWEHNREGEDNASFKNESARGVRYGALLLGIISFGGAACLVYVIGMGEYLFQFYLTAAVTLLTVLIFTMVTQSRLSLHTASLGLMIYFIHALFRQNSIPLVLITYLGLLPFVAWSRIVLGKHTVAQIVATAMITIICLVIVGGF